MKDVTGEDAPEARIYQRFKFKVIAGLEKQRWTLSEDQVREVLDAIRADLQARHEADDPHCTCNDCIESFARKQEHAK